MARYLIIAPPPTPNGGFHLGHVSGPYLGADICKRMLGLNGRAAAYVISTDNNQSYVNTTAARLGVDADKLVAQARSDISSTLADYQLGVDLFGDQDEAYDAYVKKGFSRLFDAKHLRWCATDVLYDKATSSYPVESYISGSCPHCFAPTCGGICEACGHANDAIDIVDNSSGRYEVRHEQRLVFDIEKFRAAMAVELGKCSLRPYLKNLVGHYLAAPIPPFVMSYKIGRGIDTAFCGEPGQQLNVWGEMLFGHRYFLEKNVGEVRADDRYVQFFGYDNSYFYVILHTAMSLALKETGCHWPLPAAFVTNQFYNLEAAKFSTSKGHLIWANDFSQRHNPDLIRLYLALNGPELQEADFVEAIFERESTRLLAKINRLSEIYNEHGDAVRGPVPDTLKKALAPYSFDLERLADFMIGGAARKAVNVMDLIIRQVELGHLEAVAAIPAFIQNLLSPFCPGHAQICGEATGSAPHKKQILPRMEK
jgi:methionyl-tRNA synthetase